MSMRPAWHTDRQKELPLGVPQRMMGFKADGQIDDGHVVCRGVSMDTTSTLTHSFRRPALTWPPPATAPKSGPISLGLVDDHPIVRTGLVDFLSQAEGIRVTGVAADTAQALDIIRTRPMDVLILDLGMPGRSGLDVLGMLRSKAPNVAVLVYTGYPADQYAVKLLQQGVRAYLQKTCELDDLLAAVRALASGRRYITPDVSQLLAMHAEQCARPTHAGLTDRELQVLLKLARGVRTEKIADHLALSVKTVSTYRARLLAKLELGSNNDLTYYALKHQLID